MTTPFQADLVLDKNVLTNEERKVSQYGQTCPTIPETVNHKTPLKQLNLNWSEKELPERIRTKHIHRLHPYLGKYIPQLVEVFLRKYFRKDQTIYDPFSGSGTSLIQANELGIHAIGCDISQFNVLLTRAKSSAYSLVSLSEEVPDILNRVSKLVAQYVEDDYMKAHGEAQSEYLREWFAPQALTELLIYNKLIPEYENQDLLKIILSRSARSARRTTHFDLDFPKLPCTEPYHCYKHRRVCKPTNEALKFLKRYSADTLKRIDEFSRLRTNAGINIIHGDSRTINPGKIDGVLTSPPYVGLINYHQQHQYAYELFDIENRDELEIGPAYKGTSIRAKQEYIENIAAVFINTLHYLPTGSRLIVIAGDKHHLYPEIASACNVKVCATLKRHVNRRTGRRSGEFYESIFIWKK